MSLTLSEEGELQVQAYLRFAKLKRDQHVREVVSTINDFKAEHIHQGEMYSYKEVIQLFQELEQETKQLVDKEIQNAYHANALLVKILLSQAQSQGSDLFVDTHALENEFLLKQISSSEVTALSRPASDFLQRKNAALGKLGAVATMVTQDPALITERDKLKADLASAQERLMKLQEETTKMMRERTTLNHQINDMKDELAAKDKALASALAGNEASAGKLQKQMEQLSASATSKSQITAAEMEQLKKHASGLSFKVAACMDELQAARNQLALKDKELRAATDAIHGKLQESKPFLQMKQLMQAKSQEAAALRKKLEKYEPQNVPSADVA
ncbi:hypothetical protein VOLCADRAFT_89775 [Volvox carteri f. nagariensis]|uniref:Leucine zipper transcription factor-like protein 1 n=1 Tax=Volvox carteri f. nagariensis TaxID=3068 RepID=D8TSL5_VOLCA|nr:uncharacterized protein VOLCADRAFT_89775 [Volvox carteri f. nagariensis]EFJ49393.1 hypothetical protein VOLCADRAFT_89775 [Volvox carteri f. nagariensis]|eukprot:XP_002949374.1 hypothetical protein VOLCADRAFT_89775 [Volvox carteri f. nagariensis]